MSTPLYILIVEDSEDDARLLVEELRHGGIAAIWERVETGEAMIAALRRQRWDIVIADFNLPQFSGVNALQTLQQHAIEVPLILVSGSVAEEMAVDAMLAGARDFIVKDRPVRLVPAVRRELDAAAQRRQQLALEAKLQREQDRFRALVEKSAEAILVIDPSGRINYESPSAERIVGYSPREQIGRDAFEFVHPDEIKLLRRDMAELLAEPGSFRVREFRYRHKDGTWRWLEGIATNLLHDPNIQGFVANIRDISDRKALEEQFLHAQKMEAFGQLAGGVAHDFNNILTTILIQLDLLECQRDLPGSITEALQELGEGARRAAALTRQLLVFSRRQPIKKQTLNLDDLLTSLIRMLHRLLGERVQLEHRPAGTPLWIHADAGMIEQVAVNLCVNARDAMVRGGRLVIATSRIERPERVPPDHDPAAGYACLSVTDTGCGMDPATLQRIFEPFFTTKEVGKGTGLGLATVYGIVKEHQGWIDVESEPGAGATFRVHLPEVPAGAPDIAAGSAMRGGTEGILVVEDEVPVRELTARCLRRSGYRVFEAANAAEARKTWDAARGDIDLLLTDQVMPGDTSGVELAQQLKASRPELPCILTTGYCDEDMAAPAALGIGLLPKPFEVGQLLAAVREALDRPENRESPAPT